MTGSYGGTLGPMNRIGEGEFVENEKALLAIMQRSAKAYREATGENLDPDLLAIGIRAPALTRKQRNQNQMRAVGSQHAARVAAKTPRERYEWVMERNKRRAFYRSTEGKATKQQVSDILARYRRLGEVRG